MNLIRALNTDEDGIISTELVESSNNIDHLKDRGKNLCQGNGVADASWVSGGIPSYQDLMFDGHSYYYVRP